MPTPVGHALGGFAFGWLIAAAGQPAAGQSSATADGQPRVTAAGQPSATAAGQPSATAHGQSRAAVDAHSRAEVVAQSPPTASTATPSSTLTRIREQLRAGWRRAAVFAALGALPDIDLLFHVHSTYTHSLGAALLAALVAWAIAASRAAALPDASANASTIRSVRPMRPVRPVRPAAMALACGAAWGSHVLLDWLGTDRSPPSGITALWPFSSAYYYSALDLFPAVDRRYWLPGFWQRAFNSVAWELILLLPVTALVLWLRAPAPSPQVDPDRIAARQ